MTPLPDRRQGFTLVELLVVIAIIAIIAGLVVPTLMNAQSHAYKLTCMSNLRGLHSAAYIYSQKKKRYPLARGMKDPPAHESIQVLLNHAAGDSLEPENLICPEGGEQKALLDIEEGPGASFLLDETTLSYTWPMALTRPTRKGYLSCDKYAGGDFVYEDGVEHLGHQNVLVIVSNAGRVTEADTTDEEDLMQYKFDLVTLLPKGLTR